MADYTDLVKLLAYGVYFSKKAEICNALLCTEDTDISETDLLAISILSNLISSPEPEGGSTKEDMLEMITVHAMKYMENSANLIPRTECSYARARDCISLLEKSSYCDASARGVEVNYAEADIGGFWDYEWSKIPKNVAVKDLKRNIEAGLRKLGYNGNLILHACVDKKSLSKEDAGALEEVGITIRDMPPATNNKRKVDKAMVVEAISWARLHLAEHYEPANVLFITPDIDILYAQEHVRFKRFQVILAHNGGITTEQIVKSNGRVLWENLAQGN